MSSIVCVFRLKLQLINKQLFVSNIKRTVLKLAYILGQETPVLVKSIAFCFRDKN